MQPAIKPWDIYEVHKGLEIDLEHQTAEDITFENLHRAAFRFINFFKSLFLPSKKLKIKLLSFRDSMGMFNLVYRFNLVLV